MDNYQILQLLGQSGFAGLAFILMYKMSRETIEKLRETVQEHTVTLKENTVILRELKDIMQRSHSS